MECEKRVEHVAPNLVLKVFLSLLPQSVGLQTHLFQRNISQEVFMLPWPLNGVLWLYGKHYMFGNCFKF